MFRDVLYQVEHRRAARRAESLTRPAAPKLVTIGRNQAVWELAVPGVMLPVYMRAERDVDEAESFVVHVAGDLFYLAMLSSVRVLRTSSHGLAHMARSDMPKDYKFHHAVKGFQRTADYPVPLAEPAVGVSPRGAVRITGFSNGITRTYWLLANNCPAFPVLIHGQQEAELLAEQVGMGVHRLSELFGS